MAENKFLINVTERGAKKASKNMKALGGSMGSVLKSAAALGAAYFGSRALLNGMQEAIRLSGEQELVEKRLANALDGSTQALLDQASALQQQTRFGDEAIIEQQAFLASLDFTEQQIKDVIPVALDLAEATGQSLEFAVKNTAKTFAGLTGELGELVPQLKDLTTEQLKNGEATKLLADLFGGTAAAAADTLQVKLQQMQNAFGDVLENIGDLAKPLVEIVAVGLKGFAEGIETMLDSLKGLDVGATFTNLINDVSGFGVIVSTVLEEFVRLIPTMLNDAFKFALGTIQQIGIRLLEVFKNLVPFLKDVVFGLFEPIPIIFDMAINRIKTGFTIMWTDLKNLAIDGVNLLIEPANAIRGLLGFEDLPMLARTSTQAATQGLNEELAILQEDLASTGLANVLTDIFSIDDDNSEQYTEAYANISEKIKAMLAENAVFSKQQKDKEVEDAKKANFEILKDAQLTSDAVKQMDLSNTTDFVERQSQNLETIEQGGAKIKALSKAASIAATIMSTIEGAQKAYAADAALPPLAVAAAATATAAGMARVKQIQAVQEGYSGVVDSPTMFLAGENGAENVQVTNLDVPGGGLNSPDQAINVFIEGNVLTQDFVEGQLAESIEDAIRRGSQPYRLMATSGIGY